MFLDNDVNSDNANNQDLSDLLNQACGCGSEKQYKDCCYLYHSQQQIPLTAEALMRSRFVAFQLKLNDYLKASWDPENCPADLDDVAEIKWTRLNINGRKKGRKKDQEGWVTFVAYYEHQGQEGAMHEKSYFKKDTQDNWLYVNGEVKN